MVKTFKTFAYSPKAQRLIYFETPEAKQESAKEEVESQTQEQLQSLKTDVEKNRDPLNMEKMGKIEQAIFYTTILKILISNPESRAQILKMLNVPEGVTTLLKSLETVGILLNHYIEDPDFRKLIAQEAAKSYVGDEYKRITGKELPLETKDGDIDSTEEEK